MQIRTGKPLFLERLSPSRLERRTGRKTDQNLLAHPTAIGATGNTSRGWATTRALPVNSTLSSRAKITMLKVRSIRAHSLELVLHQVVRIGFALVLIVHRVGRAQQANT